MNQAELILLMAKLWTATGAVVAVPFLIFGIDRIDEDARGAYVFRPLLVPGILLIWPMVLWRWFILANDKDAWPRRYRPRRASYPWFAVLMPIAIIAIIATSLSLRQTWPDDIAPVRLSAPQEVTQ